MPPITRLVTTSLATAVAVALGACGNDDDTVAGTSGGPPATPIPAAPVGDTVVVTADGRPVSFDGDTDPFMRLDGRRFGVDLATGALSRYRALSADAAQAGGATGAALIDLTIVF